ncbi:MAG: UDP-N-acetylmuramoyl-tripeptide--D-alanyl-D-alanine ligase [Patescibacteria group bacterium]|nr:MAG: UDP-N-acetylmuramoyl-tripeptide--D-alanyl-D-alanine ligase [Patescibacteria group bacterium]
MLKHLKALLAFLARAVLARYAPKIVAVAGSVGKTSTTRAVAATLARSFPTRGSAKNHNNEIGVPLTILGEAKSGGRSPFAWAAILWRGFLLAFGPARPYPRVLVLEMATDHPGDLAYLASIAPPDVAVLTAIAEEHTEFLGDLDGVAEEEGSIVRSLSKDGTAVLNADDARVVDMKAHAPRAVLFGFGEGAFVRAERAEPELALGTVFTRFDLVIDGKRFPVNLPNALGDGNVYAALAAASVALAFHIDPAMIPFGLAEYEPPPGRLRVLPGIKETMLVDDSYNSSPRAAELALGTFQRLPVRDGGRRIAVLGDMLELGALTESAHHRIGQLAARSGIELLIGVGAASASLCRGAREAGMNEERVFHFQNSQEAGRFLQERIRPGDLVLIKGSQGIRTERIVKELMAEPERAGELLVRQSKDWLN